MQLEEIGKYRGWRKNMIDGVREDVPSTFTLPSLK
jgi:hypothetical protein